MSAHLRALGTTVTLALDRTDDPDRRRGRAALRARRHRPRLQPLPVRLRDPEPVRRRWSPGARRARCCTRRSRWPVRWQNVPEVRSTRPSGHAVEALGYDRDFVEVPAIGPPLRCPTGAGTGLVAHRARRSRRARSRFPRACSLDLGATAKALVADRAASGSHRSRNRACWSAWAGTWRSRVRPRTTDGPSGSPSTVHGPFEAGPVVSISVGGLASSSTTVRPGVGDGGSSSHRRPGHRRLCQRPLAAGVGGRRQLCRCQRLQHRGGRLGRERPDRLAGLGLPDTIRSTRRGGVDGRRMAS